MGEGLPCYQIKRMNISTGKPFNDGSHILYVNGTYRGNTEIGKLMHDFSCWDPAEMNYELLKNATRYYKETQEGVEYMCKAFEELAEKRADEKVLEEKRDVAVRMIADGKLSAEEIARYLGLPINMVEELANLQTT